MMSLSKRIRGLRYAKGWGPDELAIRAKISRTALYQIERGNTSKPQAGTLRRISRALGVDLEDLMDDVPRPGTVDSAGMSSAPNSEGDFARAGVALSHGGGEIGRIANMDRAEELIEKFRRLLSSPLAEGVAVIVEESYRLLPIIPPLDADEPARYTPSVNLEAEAKRNRGNLRNAD
jgi:transcriptional regulator with XRE-family HTH domain